MPGRIALSTEILTAAAQSARSFEDRSLSLSLIASSFRRHITRFALSVLEATAYISCLCHSCFSSCFLAKFNLAFSRRCSSQSRRFFLSASVLNFQLSVLFRETISIDPKSLPRTPLREAIRLARTSIRSVSTPKLSWSLRNCSISRETLGGSILARSQPAWPWP